MSLEESCEVQGCSNPASRLTTTESRYITICDSCWHEKYKK